MRTEGKIVSHYIYRNTKILCFLLLEVNWRCFDTQILHEILQNGKTLFLIVHEWRAVWITGCTVCVCVCGCGFVFHTELHVVCDRVAVAWRRRWHGVACDPVPRTQHDNISFTFKQTERFSFFIVLLVCTIYICSFHSMYMAVGWSGVCVCAVHSSFLRSYTRNTNLINGIFRLNKTIMIMI